MAGVLVTYTVSGTGAFDLHLHAFINTTKETLLPINHLVRFVKKSREWPLRAVSIMIVILAPQNTIAKLISSILIYEYGCVLIMVISTHDRKALGSRGCL